MSILCGIDEVGRGPLVGPVTAVAVNFTKPVCIEGLDDSKKVSSSNRLEISSKIIEECLCYGIGWSWPEEIDRLNIHHASLLAMRRAYFALSTPPDKVLIDGKYDPLLPTQSFCIIGGDRKIQVIQAASIIAKVIRDGWMIRYAWIEPAYGFHRHKGYPTIHHRHAILNNGISAIHRYSFRVKPIRE